MGIARIKEIAAQPTSTTPTGFGQPSRSASLNVGGKDYTLDFDFPVGAQRQRCQSLMWCIGWGLLFFTWLIKGLRAWSIIGSLQDTGVLGVLFDSEASSKQIAKLYSALMSSMVFTPLLLLGLEFVWSIRKVMGRKAAHDA